MNSHGMTYDELSQAISESYLHLSNDDTNEFSGSSIESQDMTNENGYDTSTLMRLAKAIDEKQRRAMSNVKETRTSHMHESPKGGTAKNRVKGEGRGEKTTSFISSHSTPLVSKQSSSRIRPARRKSHTLSDVEETFNEPSCMGGNRIVESSRDVAMNELRQMIESLSLEEIEEFKKPIETRITSHTREKERKAPQHYHHNTSDMFHTPKRSYINALSSDSGSSGEDDDDRLSLTHTNTNGSYLHKKKSRISHNKPVNNKPSMKMYDSSSGEENGKLNLTGIHLSSNDNLSSTKKPRNRNDNDKVSSIDEIENELDSAITTPPHSQEYTNAKNESYEPHTMNRSILPTSDHTDNESSLNNTSYIPRRTLNKHRSKHLQDTFAPILTPKKDSISEQSQLEIELLKKENLNLRIKLNELEIKLSEKETNAIDNDEASSNDNSFVFNNTDNHDSNDKIDELTITNNQLNLQLTNSKNHMSELNNEIRYLKNKISNNNNEDDLTLKAKQLGAQIESLQNQIGNLKNLITQDSILDDYKQFYSKLQLNHVDRLTKIEMSNLIKNLMLSLLITDFEHLPMVSSKIGKFFKIISLFMDQLHSMVYDDSSTAIRPSHYLKNHEYGMNELQSCLDGMIETLLYPTQQLI